MILWSLSKILLGHLVIWDISITRLLTINRYKLKWFTPMYDCLNFHWKKMKVYRVKYKFLFQYNVDFQFVFRGWGFCLVQLLSLSPISIQRWLWATSCSTARYRWPARSLPARRRPPTNYCGRPGPAVNSRPNFSSTCAPISGSPWCWSSCSVGRSCPGNSIAGPGTFGCAARPSTRRASPETPAGISLTSGCTVLGWPSMRSNKNNQQSCTAVRWLGCNTANPWRTGTIAAEHGTVPNTGRTLLLRPLKVIQFWMLMLTKN